MLFLNASLYWKNRLVLEQWRIGFELSRFRNGVDQQQAIISPNLMEEAMEESHTFSFPHLKFTNHQSTIEIEKIIRI